MLFLALFFAPPGQAADCAAPVSPAALSATADDALMAFAVMDQDGFTHSAGRVADELTCLDAPLSPAQAAEVHRVVALRHLLSGEEARVVASLRAADRVEPGHPLSDKIAPRGGKLDLLQRKAALLPAPPPLSVDVPPGEVLWVDGTPSSVRYGGLPAVLQVSEGKRITESLYLEAGTPFALPAPAVPAPAPAVAEARAPATRAPAPAVTEAPLPDPRLDVPVPARPHHGRGLWVAAGATGALAAAAWGTSAGFRRSYDAAPTLGKHTATNATWFASVGLGAGAVGLLTAALAGGAR